MSETSLGRYNKKPTMRVQKAEVGPCRDMGMG